MQALPQLSQRKKVIDSLKSAADRTKQVTLNNDIALYAKRKDLNAAMALFDSAIDQGIANSHTYAAAVNANIRCGSLDGAEKVMAEMAANGRRKDVIICTTMMKGYCGDGKMTKAVALLDEMLNSKPVILPNIRTINTILRGCVQSGDIDKADAVLTMAAKDLKIALDVSSWEYMVVLFCQGLRLDKALPIVGRLRSDPSMASGMVNMNVNIARAAALLGEWKTCRKAIAAASELISADGAVPANNDSTTVAATTAVDASTSKASEKKQVVGGKRAWKSGPGAASNDDGRDGGGVGDEFDQRRLQSLELFRAHSKEEMRAELQVIEAFMVSRTAPVPATATAGDSSNKQPHHQQQSSSFMFLYPYFLRMFSFSSEHVMSEGDAGADAAAESSGAGGGDRERVLAATLHNADNTFGLGAFVTRVTGKPLSALIGAPPPAAAVPTAPVVASGTEANTQQPVSKNTKKKGGKGGTNSVEAAPAVVSAAAAEAMLAVSTLTGDLGRSIDAVGKIDFDQVFSSLKHQQQHDKGRETQKRTSTAAAGAVKPAAAAPPRSNSSSLLKMEICSGAGEWAVAQASQDKESRWVTLELRHDRVYQTFTRAVFAGASNMCILGGDAMRILPDRIADGVVDRLFVNHPEPPQQTGGVESQGKHLLTTDFFSEANRILRADGGMLTIVTDNLWYGRFLMRQVAALQAKGGASGNAGWRSMSLTSARKAGASQEDWRVQESDGEVNLFVGRPGAAAGHVVDASSYFDRLWKRGSLVERYFLVLKKGGGGAASGAAGPAARQRELISASLKNISAVKSNNSSKQLSQQNHSQPKSAGKGVTSGGGGGGHGGGAFKANRNNKHKKGSDVGVKGSGGERKK